MEQDSAAIVVDEPLKAQAVSEGAPIPEEKALQGPEAVMSTGAKVRYVSQSSPPICSSNKLVLTLHLLLSFLWSPLHIGSNEAIGHMKAASHTSIGLCRSLYYPHRIHLAWWLSRTVYVPGGLEFEPQRLRGFLGFPGV